MGNMIDWLLVAEMAAFLVALVQIIKSHPIINGSDMPWVAGILGVIATNLWYLVNGELYHHGFNWVHFYSAFVIGVIACVTGVMGYNLQKVLPTPNLLPTSNELTEQRVAADVTKVSAEAAKEAVKDAPATGVVATADIQAVAVTTVETVPITSTPTDDKENLG